MWYSVIKKEETHYLQSLNSKINYVLYVNPLDSEFLLLKEVVEYAPLDYLLLETDAPYLSPVPRRGKSNYTANPQIISHIHVFSCMFFGISIAVNNS